VSSRMVLAVLAGTLIATAIGVAVAWLLSSDGPLGGPAGRPLAQPLGGLGRAPGGGGFEPGEPPGHPSEVSAMERTPFAVRSQGLEDRARATGWLESYGWIDRPAGLVHIPIDRAIDLYLERRGARAEEPR
jgi:hypothetical protein